jgi:hypothetical protein
MYVPAGHAWHVSFVVAPAATEYEPGRHPSHALLAVAPAVPKYEPGLHAWHAVVLPVAENVPAWHVWHAVETPSTKKLPAPQHTPAPLIRHRFASPPPHVWLHCIGIPCVADAICAPLLFRYDVRCTAAARMSLSDSTRFHTTTSAAEKKLGSTWLLIPSCTLPVPPLAIRGRVAPPLKNATPLLTPLLSHITSQFVAVARQLAPRSTFHDGDG